MKKSEIEVGEGESGRKWVEKVGESPPEERDRLSLIVQTNATDKGGIDQVYLANQSRLPIHSQLSDLN